jgi:hypothetical protein
MRAEINTELLDPPVATVRLAPAQLGFLSSILSSILS